MTIETIETGGFIPALRAMRRPLKSYEKKDTAVIENVDNPKDNKLFIGPNDKALSLKLQKAGPEHCKHLRQIIVWADITAQRSWWLQFSTYRIGVESESESTMHTLMAKEITPDNFEAANGDCYGAQLLETIDYLNELIKAYKNETDPVEKRKLWEYAIQILPQSYKQTRTVMMSYAALKNIVRQREGHKLGDWKVFIDWAHTLPFSYLIFE